MKPIQLTYFVTFTILFLCNTIIARVQEKQYSNPTASGFREEYITQLEAVKKEILDLESAIPQEKFSWRPMDGVRSISEVYLHISGSVYLILGFASYESPKEISYSEKKKVWETATTDKKEIQKSLEQAFEFLNMTVVKMTDDDLEKKLQLFGKESTQRNALITIMNHLHEHLGQSIAYARMNGVIPPWTADRLAKEKEKK
mgnify:FL=1